MKIPLYAPRDFWEATEEEKQKVCNGCGAKGGIKVPDSFFGLLIVLACNIHDWMFKNGVTYGDFIFANLVFLYNLIALIINGSSNSFSKTIRFISATTYFYAVMTKGECAFWNGKTKKDLRVTISFKGEFKHEIN